MKRVFSFFFIGFILIGYSIELPKPVSGRPETKDAINSADTLSRAKLLRAELMHLNWVMGKPDFEPTVIEVSDVTAREVYFQAETVMKKCSQLQFELFGKKSEIISSVSDITEMNPYEVYKMINKNLEIVLNLKTSLKIDKISQEQISDSSSTQTKVFREIFTINELLNQLMSKPVSPSDVYMRVSDSIHHAVKIIRADNKAISGIPEPDEFLEGKKPSDVYRKLLKSYEIIQTIAQQRNMGMMKFTPPEEYINEARPEDVYDLASIILSEVAYLHSQTPKADRPVPVYFPGLKFPSHVFQRVSILEKQLEMIKQGK